MKEITLTINDKQVKGKEGDTVLGVCKANGIDVPTLCHFEGLSDVGACRMCVVEIERERRPVPACTYPARDGLVVKTNTEKLEKYRRLILELIFTERNHYCMFCEQSGDCELQKLAYRYQMDNVRYPYTFPAKPVDSSNDYLAVDHNRCILCGRCVRACAEIAGINTLDFSKRGWKTMVAADITEPLGESSCISCGACLQACPTGAIFCKLSIYKGRTTDCQQVTTVCPICGVGCELDVLVRDNNLVMIKAPKLTQPRGSLCKMGRFELLRPTSARITSPLIRNKQGQLEECTIDSAIEAIAEKVRELKGSFGGMVSTRIPDETLSLFHKFMHDVVATDYMDTLDGVSYRVISEGIKQFSKNGKGMDIECPIEEILESDCIIVVGADPIKTHPVVGSLIRRAGSQKGTQLIVIDSSRDAFAIWSGLWLKPKAGSEGIMFNGLVKILVDKGLVKREKLPAELAKSLNQYDVEKVSKATGIGKEDLESAANMYGKAKHGVIIYGEGLLERNDPKLVASLLDLANLTGNLTKDKLRVISLKPNSNSRGAWELGLAAKGLPQAKVKGLYLMLGDEQGSEELVGWLKGLDFVAVQAGYHSAATSAADVVLPSPIWVEREGKYVSMDGRSLKSNQVLQPKNGLLEDREIFAKLSKKLGKS
jgi:formate dehydrogenase major subunit